MNRWRRYVRWAAVTLAMSVIYQVSARVEVFDWLHRISHRHEAWQLDEAFSFFFTLAVMLPFVLGYGNFRLRRSLRRQRKAEAHARHVSRHDALTGLFNRRALTETLRIRIDRAAEGQARLSVILFDLDRFKPINDLRGHDAGDLVLREVARRLRDLCAGDQMPVRLGGDEFAVVVDESSDFDVGTRLAKRILRSVEEPVHIGDWTALISASIGIAIWQKGLDTPQLLRNADQAMYRAKRDGRGRYAHFDAALGERLREEAEFETELKRAIDTGDIVPHFQPILDIAERRIIGFEVLARWSHRDYGQVPPDRFIAVAEETGQIGRLSDLMLRESCKAARDWDPALSISVNLSPRQFQDRNLARIIESVLRETGFPPSRLEIEITEAAVVVDLDYARETVETLRWLGIRLSLDDFGTGFSSLATLSRLPFDRIKIDRSFIAQVSEDPQKAKVVAGIILLAGSLDISVVAEGIETEEEFAFLADLNCHLGQGFLFEQALPVEQIANLLNGSWHMDPVRRSAPDNGDATRQETAA